MEAHFTKSYPLKEYEENYEQYLARIQEKKS